MSRRNRTPEEKKDKPENQIAVANGRTMSDTEAHIHDIYGLEVSDTTVNRITDKILQSPRNGGRDL